MEKPVRRDLSNVSRDQMVGLFLRPIPRLLRDQFKAFCARRGITMIQRILDLIKEDIKTDTEGVTSRAAIKREIRRKKKLEKENNR